ncbi:hypothetical protein [Paractinoplanes globisporus]|uniref:Uncharacterized protein n=1 Tax=Paractinoplanes globisporus TaxID=113565 RepID=A0ABW6WFM1_9ACTN|nr:hypothetical protein [Actinoplanes globisporus]
MPASTQPGTPDYHDVDHHPSAVVAATRDDLPELAGLATASALDTPTGCWLVPDRTQRPVVLQGWYLMLLEQALRQGRVDMIAGRSAVAAWIDRSGPAPDLRSSLRRLTAACGKHTIALLSQYHQLHRNRPGHPHLDLAVLAADDPAAVALLLAHRLRRLDLAGIPTHAFADSLSQRDLLGMAGYQAGEPFMAAAGPQLWPMWRPADATQGTWPARSAQG